MRVRYITLIWDVIAVITGSIPAMRVRYIGLSYFYIIKITRFNSRYAGKIHL